MYLERDQLSSDAPRFESIVRNVAYELSPRFHVADAEIRRSGVPAGLYPPRMDTHAGGTLCRYFTQFNRIQTDAGLRFTL